MLGFIGKNPKPKSSVNLGASLPAPTPVSATITADDTVVVAFTIPGTSPLLPSISITGFVVRTTGSPMLIGQVTSSGSNVTISMTEVFGLVPATGTVTYNPGNLTDSSTPTRAAQAFMVSLIDARDPGGGLS